MDSSPVLRQQSQNKIRSDFRRMKNEHNKKQADPKPSKPLVASHLSHKDSENKDPGHSETGRKTPVRPGVSRLPVLAKSLRLQTPSDFTQSHCRWEEKPLAGKAKKKKPCTRPIPFNLSQPKSSRTATENQQPLMGPKSRTGTHAVQPENNMCNVKPTKHSALLDYNADSNRGMGKSHRKATENTSYPSGQSGPPNTFKTSATLSNPLLSIPNNTMHQHSSTSSSVQPPVSAEACVDNMNLLSLKDPAKTFHDDQTSQQTTKNNPSKGLTGKGENFQSNHAALLSILQNEGVSVAGLSSATPQSKPYNYLPQRVSVMKGRLKPGATAGENFQSDHAALLSILKNEGVSVAGLSSATPQSKPYNYLPQRVSVMKSRQKPGAAAGSVKSVQFSPDPTALQSILQNEGVKAGRPVDATPRSSVCPPGRGTSVYSAQRVPVRKNRAEAADGPAAVALKETPLKKWTPQRVLKTRHQPMSSMKWHLSAQQSPYGTPGLKSSSKTSIQPHQEPEVVQKLFDEDDEQSTEVTEDPEKHAEQLPLPASAIESHCDAKAEMSPTNGAEEEQKFLLPAPPRESVIFFSTGKKLLRVPRFEKQESSVQQDQHDPVSSGQRKLLPVQDEISTESQKSCQTNSSVQHLHRDINVQKSCSLSPAVAMLRKRFPPLEELLMDEEVATYTSVSVPAPPGFVPPRPRCGNPLASILHFEESTRFVPIGFDLPSAPSPLCSPLHGR